MRFSDTHIYRDAGDVIKTHAPDEPCFLFDAGRLDQDSTRFLRGFNGALSYAVKANPGLHILNQLYGLGIRHFDVASPAEIKELLAICPDAVAHYNNPIRSESEIETALHHSEVKSFSIDHEDGLNKLVQLVAPQKRGAIDIMVRFKGKRARKAYDFGSKFGADPDTAAQLLKQAHQAGFGAYLGFHVGSQCEETYAFERHIAVAKSIANQAGVTLQTLNLGGGFPAPYSSAVCPPLDQYFDTVHNAVKRHFTPNPPQLMAEPGRALVAGCSRLLARVRHVRGDNRLYINDGVYGGLMEAKFMPIIPPTQVWRGNELLQGECKPFTLFGPTCDSYDVLPRPFMLPSAISDGDWIEFELMGAYAQASLTQFNGLGNHAFYQLGARAK